MIDPSNAGPVEVLIGIPTYRRPIKLARLLESLEPSLRSVRARVVVADNACDDVIERLVEAFAKRWPATCYEPVSERGIAANRNAIPDKFRAPDETAPLLAMVDDDLVLDPDWLPAIVATSRRYDADVVGGPYVMTKVSQSWVANQSWFVKRPRRPTGPCAPIRAAGNVLISRRLLSSHPDLRFDNAYGLSGGEDYDFFGRAAKAGARFAWCDEAFAEEDVDDNRLTGRAVFYRYFSSGIYMAVIDRDHEGWATTWRRHVVGMAKAGAITVQGLLRFDRARAVEGALASTLSFGGLVGLAGLRLARYK